MKIVLTRPNDGYLTVTPPLGLGYLCSYLKEHGIEASLIDGNKEGWDVDTLARAILARRPDAVGISCLTSSITATKQLCRALGDEVTCVVGGCHPTFLPASTLSETGADYIIRGEGELALLALLQDRAPAGTAGIYARDELPLPEQLTLAQRVEELDQLPFPDWEQMDPRTYPRTPHGTLAQRFPVGVVTSSRGCPFRCSFCASPAFYQHRIRYRSPDNVVQEIQYLVSRFGVREIHFEDDNLTLNRKHIEGICHGLLEQELKISWATPNGLRADTLDEDLILLMKESGCHSIALGIESGDEAVFKKINKRESLEDIRRAAELARKHDISCHGFFILGLPGETEQSLENTIRFAMSLPIYRANFGLLGITPGSELWTTLKDKFQPRRDKDLQMIPDWVPPGLTLEQLFKAQKRAFWRFYFRPAVLWQLLRSIKPNQMQHVIKRLIEYL